MLSNITSEKNLYCDPCLDYTKKSHFERCKLLTETNQLTTLIMVNRLIKYNGTNHHRSRIKTLQIE